MPRAVQSDWQLFTVNKSVLRVQLPTLADIVALPAFVAARRGAAQLLLSIG